MAATNCRPTIRRLCTSSVLRRDFQAETTARFDATFGGQYGARVTSELTAVPIVVDKDRPTVETLNGVLRAGDLPLAVAAVEQPRAQIFMVRDHASLARMAHIRTRQEHIGMPVPHRYRQLSNSVAKTHEDRMHTVVPNPVPRADRLLFPTSPGIGLEQWPLPWLATHLTGSEAALKGQKIADAASVAGIRAGSDGTPRMVLVIIPKTRVMRADFRSTRCASICVRFGFRFHVWSVGGAPPATWGDTEDVTSNRGLQKASKRLLRELNRQWIVWVEGNHMINRIELAPDVQGIRLAGVDP